MENIHEATEHIRKYKNRLVIKELARFIYVDQSALQRAIKGTIDVKGYQSKIPKRCLPRIIKFFEQLTPKK